MYLKIVELIDGGAPLAAALVVSAQGSTPQRAGARAIVEQSGRLWGTVGGGTAEAAVLRIAAEVCQSQRPRLLDFEMTNLDAADEGAICGGRMRVLVDPTVARHRRCFAQAADALVNRRRGCLLTRIRTVPEAEVEVQWLTGDSLPAGSAFPGGDAIRSCLESGRPRRFVAEALASEAAEEVFVEPVLPNPLLVIAGGGHVGHAVALEALRVGFDVTLIDDRPEFAAASLFPPGVNVLCGPIPEQIAACPLDEDSFVVLVTRGHRHDAQALAACVHRRLTYLGMIGSRRKVALIRKNFLETGLATEEEFGRVRAPIGLEIGAVTVPEIAVSIVAQLIAVRRGASLS
ncbi:MAG: XdhC family protein [Thermoguttaceae bacterium]|jgi:xanthine dehydrogenase accessory factor